MQKKLQPILLATVVFAIFQTAALGQVEKRPVKVMQKDQGSIAELRKNADSLWTEHLDKAVKSGDLKLASNAARVAKDVNGKAKDPFIYYSVPAMSENQYLPDAYPLDGYAMEDVRILTAGDEYEPGSFLIYPLKDLGKGKLTLTPFKTKDGKVFPPNELDLKVIKVWYQNKNAWYSYFSDRGRKLVPELLLNDEDLIKVDTEATHNYARLTEKNGEVRYKWISPPGEIDVRHGSQARSGDGGSFLFMHETFSDAKTLQPVLLQEGAFKQFFLTSHAPKGQAPGFYHGSIRLTDASGKAIGEIPVTIHVLPFDLPAPKAYYDLNKRFLTCSYNYLSIGHLMGANGGNRELAWKQLEAILLDQVKHGQMMHWLPGTPTTARTEEFECTLEIMEKVGMYMDPLLGDYPTWSNSKFDAKLKHDWYMKRFGHTNVFLAMGDEPGADAVIEFRKEFRIYQDQGFEFVIAGGDNVLFKAGYSYGWFNDAKNPDERQYPRRWNEIRDAHLAWYATHHIGPENPAFNRRQYGMAPYLAGYSAFCNYAHHIGPYNDAAVKYYRPMVFAYGCYDGVLDTLQWEGHREGIDDIRYATLLKTLALETQNSSNVDIRYAGSQATQYLALMETDKGNLDTIRYEMIQHILKLKNLLKK